jgi:branched-chain amino acid transport system ATP-binding protein
MSDPVEASGAAATAPVLDVRGLTVRYGRVVTAVRGVDLALGRQEILGVLGPNGAGKTTLLRGIGGLLPLEPAKVVDGTVTVEGTTVRRGAPPSRMARLGVTLVPERVKVFATLTVAQHFRLMGASRAEMEKACAPFPWAERLLKHPAGDLSGGQRQLLSLLCALVRHPKVLLVDEFSLGLSPAAIAEVAGAIRTAVAQTGVSVLVVEQNVEVACDLCSRVAFMGGGEITWSGSPAEARQRALAGATLA